MPAPGCGGSGGDGGGGGAAGMLALLGSGGGGGAATAELGDSGASMSAWAGGIFGGGGPPKRPARLDLNALRSGADSSALAASGFLTLPSAFFSMTAPAPLTSDESRVMDFRSDFPFWIASSSALRSVIPVAGWRRGARRAACVRRLRKKGGSDAKYGYECRSGCVSVSCQCVCAWCALSPHTAHTAHLSSRCEHQPTTARHYRRQRPCHARRTPRRMPSYTDVSEYLETNKLESELSEAVAACVDDEIPQPLPHIADLLRGVLLRLQSSGTTISLRMTYAEWWRRRRERALSSCASALTTPPPFPLPLVMAGQSGTAIH